MRQRVFSFRYIVTTMTNYILYINICIYMYIYINHSLGKEYKSRRERILHRSIVVKSCRKYMYVCMYERCSCIFRHLFRNGI